MDQKSMRHISVALLLVFILNLFLPGSPGFSRQAEGAVTPTPFIDVEGHWAENEIQAWATRNLSGGYPDGTFQPDRPVARVEFFAWLNRVFGYPAAESSPTQGFTDIMGTEWFAEDIDKAVVTGYLGGYPDGTVKALQPLTREEAAALLLKILPPPVFNLSMTGGNTQDLQFTDAEQIPAWSKPAIQAAIGGGYMGGYPDGTFRPDGFFTRAEAIAVLNRAAGTTYSRAGTYGPVQGRAVINGNVTISSSDIVLQNITINGNLYLTEGIGSGKIDLKNVTVQGSVKISGGGNEGGICISDSTLGVVLAKGSVPHPVGIRAEGDTSVAVLNIQSPVCIEERDSTSGFSKLLIELAEHTQTQAVVLKGSFDDVTVKSPAQVELQRGNIRMLNLEATAQGSKMQLTSGTNVQDLRVDADDTLIQGKGIIGESRINGKRVIINLTDKSGKTKKSRNPAKAITGFSFAGLDPDVVGVINEGAKTITLTVPYGTDVTALAPTIAHTGASVSPNTGVAQDFTSPVIYTVTAADETTAAYTVTVNVALNPAKAITGFSFAGLDPDVVGVINEGAKTITLTVPYGTDVTALVPTIVHTGASVSPNTGVAQDFTSPVVYTVTAADESTAEYTVTVIVAANPAKEITGFRFEAFEPDVVGAIDEETKTITLTVPYGTAVTALVPTIVHTGASVSPASGAAQDFTNPVAYTVTAADGSTAAYTVTVNIAANPAKAITSFSFESLDPDVVGDIDEGAKTITLTVPYGTNVTALAPTIAITGTSVAPNTGAAQDFTNPVAYTVTAADGSTAAYTVTVNIAANPAKAITSFSFESLDPDVVGDIDEGAKTITLTVPYGTNVTALAPTIAITGTSVAPNTGAAQDFTNPVAYTVTAADGSTAAYTVTVNIAANPAKAITSFSFESLDPDVVGDIDEGAKTITLTVPYGTNVTALAPTIAITGTSVAPNTGAAQDFTNPVAYTVTAADGSTAAYTVTVNIAANPAKAITSFSFESLDPDVVGDIDEGAKTITLTVPYGTNVTALAPTIAITGTSVAPNTGAAQDFTNPVAYTVTAADGSTAAYTVTVNIAANPAKAITSFSFESLDPDVVGDIDEGAKTITLTVPYGTNVTALAPTIAITGTSVAPNTGAAQDFTNPVAYTVTAADGSTAAYTVTVNIAANPAKAITSFSFESLDPDVVGDIDEGAKTITLTVPYGTNVTALAPTIAITGTSVAPNTGAAQDFTNPVAYTVTAADGSTAAYTVTVNIAANPAKAITGFSFAGLDPDVVGDIDEGAKTITLTVPYGTDVTALAPTIAITGTSVAPVSGEEQDFTSPVTYTVTAADGSTAAYTVTVNIALNPAKAITGFSFAGLDPDVVGVINEGAKTITLTVPYGTDVTALAPTIAHTGASVSPNTGVAQDFTSPVTYTVTAADETTAAYTVTVNIAANPAKAITGFSFAGLDPDVVGDIDEGAKTITLTVPYGTDVTALAPTITHTGASVAPNTGAAQDFTSPVTYTVTAADGSTAAYTVTVNIALNPAKAITGFSFAGLDPDVVGVINEGAKTITLTVPYGTDVTALAPTIAHTGASVSPNTGVAQDFTSPVTYTVTAADETTAAYTVTVNIAANPAKAITGFSFAGLDPDVVGDIDEGAKTITLTVPYGTDVTALAPTITHTGASVAPNTGAAQDFTSPVTYTVTAADGSTAQYTVTVNIAANPAKAITGFSFAGLDPDVVGVINEGAKTITLTVPYGTDVTALAPTITHTGASVSPNTGVAQDFTSPVTYTVTAADETTAAYTVTVNIAANPAKVITGFSFAGLDPDVVGDIDEGAKTITLTVPYGTDVTALAPTITHTGASVSPNTGVAQDFTSPVTYTVTAADGSTAAYTVTVNIALNPAKAITGFSFAGLDPDVVGVINEGAKTITLTVPYGTDVTALAPTIAHTGASVSPNTGVAQDFTSPVTYTVTAADETTAAYTVTVNIAANPAKAITGFSFAGLDPDVVGDIDEGAKTITLTVPYGTDVTALAPTITHTGASVAPNTGAAQDFTSPVTYTVTAADGSTAQYTVTVNIAANPAKAITGFSFAGLDPDVVGVINEGAKTITLTVPYGTDVTALAPTIAHTGASVSPNTGVAQDFTSPVTYTVTAADETTAAYTVTVNIAANPAKAITGFSFAGLDPDVVGDIDEGAKTITLTVPYGTDVTALAPTITHTGASVAPNTGAAQDFTSPVTYTVTAADGSTAQYTVTVNIAANPAKAITGFSFAGLDPDVVGVINEGAKTITLTVPYGTDVTALAPTITHTGASVSPNTGVAQDFTSPVTYTVTAADETTAAYTVTVNIAANPAKVITGFSFAGLDPDVVGDIDEGAKTITLTVPYGTDVTALAPTITHTGASVSPNTGVAQDFTSPVTYTVTAADETTAAYTVTVNIAANPAKVITGFSFAGLDPDVVGDIDEGAKTITLTVPYGTDVTALAPTITHTGASVSPNTGAAQDFTSPVIYTVTAADGSTAQYTVTVNIAANPAKAITGFSFESLDPDVVGVINEGAKTITLTVPYGTDVTALAPTITHTGASVSPNTGVAQDFTSPVTYTVTAADETTAAYTVTVNIALNPAKAITGFSFAGLDPDVVGVINEGAKTITLTVPYGTDVTALAPTIAHTGASVSPNTGVAQDFTSPVTYTVTAADGSTAAYTVTVNIAANPAKAITGFSFAGLDPDVVGDIDEGAKTITLTVPYGTDVTALAPTITITGTSVAPNTGVAQDFTSPVTYTVTAADGSTAQYTVTVNIAANPAKAITGFSFESLDPDVVGVINEGAKTITLTVPYGTDVTALAPTIAITGTSVAPNTGAAQDFTSPVTYTVTAADGSTAQYTVTVNIAANPAKAITGFSFESLDPDVVGVINEGAKTITLTVPYGTDVTALAPTIAHTGASVSPNTGVAQDFTSPVTYTVTAADETTAAYTVTVNIAANPAKAITGFSFAGLDPDVVGDIDEGAKTITLTVPYGTDVTALVPTIVHTGASVSPNTGVAQDFTSPVTYTVTAADETTAAYTVTVNIAANPAKAITGFSFAGLDPDVVGDIDEGAKTITLTVPYGTDVTALAPTITHTGASVAPVSGEEQDFTSPVTYTVTAADGSTAAYTVTVNIALNPAKAITGFSFAGLDPDVVGVINEGAKTITLTVPYGTDVTALAPTIAHTGASVSPNTGEEQDFTSPVTYTVTAADGSTAAYTVTVNIALNPAKAITGFSFAGLDPDVVGDIDEGAKTITLTVPYGTDVTALAPTIAITGASVSPNTGVAQDFTSPVTYTVTAADGSTAAYTVTVNVALNPAKAITGFSFAGLDPDVVGVINEGAKTITLTVPYGTDVTALAPTIAITGASVSPNTGAAQDFTSPVTYTVTAADGSTAQYTVTVNVALNPAKAITSFSFVGLDPDVVGDIDEGAKTITLTVPYGTDVTALAPTIAITGASVAPNTGAAQDFTNPVAYTVTAADGSTAAYTVTVNVAANPAKAITGFSFAGLDPDVVGVINEGAKTITLTVPYGTDVTALAPTIAITGASVAPNTGVAQDFTSPVTYTVTAADGSTAAYTVTVLIADSSKIISLVSGTNHSLALKGDGSVWAWGSNEDGQLGDGTTTQRNAPVEVSNITGVCAIAGGGMHSLALKGDGSVWAWGDNQGGQLGNGTRDDSITQVQVNGLTGVIAIAAGGNHSLALKGDGSVWAWGNNYFGQLGDGTTEDSITPVQVSGLTGVIAITAGANHSLALKEDGSVWGWGDNGYGQLGDGTTVNKTSPVQVSGLNGIIGISSGIYHCLALEGDGSVWGWGWNEFGQLGDGTTIQRETPVEVSGLTGITAIVGGGMQSLALKGDGTAQTWGNNNSTPVEVSGLTGLTVIAAGGGHSLALKEDGSAWAWGNNYFGQLGDGTTEDSITPVEVIFSDGLNTAKTITSFKFAAPAVTGTINEIAKTITVTVLDGTNVTALQPTIVHTGASVSPASGIAQNFTGSVVYTVTAEDGSTAVYTVTVIIADNAETISLAGGLNHNLLLKGDGSVWAWGSNEYGQLGDGTTTSRKVPVPVSGLTGITAIDGGSMHGLALKEDGTIWAWGNNQYGQLGDGTTNDSSTPVQVSGLTGVTAITGGAHHSLALKGDGSVWAWGSNEYGQLGNNSIEASSIPVPVSDLDDVIAIATGDGGHSLALKEDGTVWAWGINELGQLGNGTTEEMSKVPIQISDLTEVSAIAVGGNHNLVLKVDGTVWMWGDNQYGQLGDYTTEDMSTIPIEVSDLTGVRAIASGGLHSLVLKEDGTIWAWGNNDLGQLGDTTIIQRGTPVQVNGLTEITAFGGGGMHSLALKEDGTVWAWGDNQLGQLGDGTTVDSPKPIEVGGLTGVSAIAGGMDHSLALKGDGTVWAWGDNEFGQLGDENTEEVFRPVQVNGLTGVREIAAGGRHSLALKEDGSVWAWGDNQFGQLGDGTTDPMSNVPIEISGLTGVSAIASGGLHSLVLKEDGTIWAWGSNEYGQLGNGTLEDSSTPVQVSGLTGVTAITGGAFHSLALKGDGSVWAWGDNGCGQLGNGTLEASSTPVPVSGLTDVIAIAVGSAGGHNLALKEDGTVWAWGDNQFGQLGDGTTDPMSNVPIKISGLTDVIAIAAGGYDSLVLKEDGTIWAWGLYSPTPVEVSGLTDVIAIVGGGNHCLALKGDGGVWAWGDNQFGQLGDATTNNSSTPVAVSSPSF